MSADLTRFVHLNLGWNAHPNVPHPRAKADGDDLVLSFALNSYLYKEFGPEDEGFLRFHSCSRFRFSDVGDESWFRGQCRFSGLAPEWGEFYEVFGDFKDDAPGVVWKTHAPSFQNARNFLFYFRDNAFECSAQGWSFDQNQENALRGWPMPDQPEL